MAQDISRIPIIKLWQLLLVPIQGHVTDEQLEQLAHDTLEKIDQSAAMGVITVGVGLVKRRPELVRVGRRYAILTFGCALAAFAIMERALITRDFTVAFVAEHGSSRTPALYNFATLWSALEGSIILWALILTGYVLATVHRAANTDDPARLMAIVEGLATLALPVVFPVHPRTRARVSEMRLDALLAPLVVTEPVGYAEIVALEDSAAAVVTDSGGLQEETTVLGVPCLTLREQTERPITVAEGTNRMLPWPPTAESIVSHVARAVETPRLPIGARAPEGWDGRAAARIVEALGDE